MKRRAGFSFTSTRAALRATCRAPTDTPCKGAAAMASATGARGRTNVIGAMIGHLLLTVGLFNSNIDADTFQGWTAQDLLPKLPPRCVIVMDNAAFHKRRDIQNLILKAGHTLEFLPPYSPDLNPIEHKWVQAKARRKHSQLSIEQLFQIESFYMT